MMKQLEGGVQSIGGSLVCSTSSEVYRLFIATPQPLAASTEGTEIQLERHADRVVSFDTGPGFQSDTIALTYL